MAVLYRGKKEIASHKLGAKGNHKFKVADKNGKASTKYKVKVAATDHDLRPRTAPGQVTL